MSDAFVYMFVLGSGAASGIAVVVFVSYKIYKIMLRRDHKKAKQGRVV